MTKKSTLKNPASLSSKRRQDYKGLPSTLCAGCGHDSITNQLINSLFQSSLSPSSIVKLSGIGCASKIPAYFLSQSHGFNTIHGRMAPIATGVHMAHAELKIIGISGDGDTANIGLGGFAHLIRRNVPMLYIVANNGVYGLTKGQLSATSDFNHKDKHGNSGPSDDPPIDICRMALDLGCDFVARTFSGDTSQMSSIISAALRHSGTAVIDIISPCVTYANHEGSTKSYTFAKESSSAYQEVEFLSHPEADPSMGSCKADPCEIDPCEEEIKNIPWPDGSLLRLKRIDKNLSLLNDVDESLKALRSAEKENIILTGIFRAHLHSTPFYKKLQIHPQLVHQPSKELKAHPQKFKSLIKKFS